ncbi:hypothetical protein BKH43_06790 [Helicobacter sp. 13S00401-1]|uniref:hemolysin family protein n=1 Tax=Helicobacter sp. 13S00401-1 TaxID=1905758 RepID=UPI000BA55870|nr:hemolysin family protein [Helicobacter sp. 13S00401-1]PAF49351.1 hypothetical protein BKH43_06790 [Helicobacter sp. 13S00401-1]
MDPYHSVGVVILAILLVLLNAFFVLSEFSIVKIRKSRLEELVKLKARNAKLALKISKSLDSYLSATQLGITLASIGLGWVGEKIGRLIFAGFSLFTNDPQALSIASLILSFIIVTLLHVILGEIVPKSVAIAKSEESVLAIAKPLYAFHFVFFPVIKFFNIISNLVLRLLKVKGTSDAHSDEELKIIVGESLKEGHLDSIESEIIKNAVDFSDTLAKEIMTPRKDMVCLDKTKTLEENLEIVKNSKHTRFPYCDGSKDKIIGIIHIRSLLSLALQNKVQNLDSIAVKMLVISENISISKAIVKMHEKRVYTALVVDEYGGTAGILTTEDILQEVMGSIYDDTDENHIKKIDENSYELEGTYELDDLQETLGVDYEDKEQVTIGGYVLSLFGSMPSKGDKISDEYCEYEVLSTEDNRINKLILTKTTCENTQESKS